MLVTGVWIVSCAHIQVRNIVEMNLCTGEQTTTPCIHFICTQQDVSDCDGDWMENVNRTDDEDAFRTDWATSSLN